MPLPYEIVELPFLAGTRQYKKYADGHSVVATGEEVAAWEAFQEQETIIGEHQQTDLLLRERIAELEKSQPAAKGKR